ncbi:glycosyltransferase family 39 protein [Candidatus Sumerlaeota bacterium]|nr:glycosyltransferase family 39 protein [Candidatus Sumerlaeota bacterium]
MQFIPAARRGKKPSVEISIMTQTQTDRPAWHWAFPLAIVLLGFGLRLAWLGTPSFWFDEVIQARTALEPSLAQSLTRVPADKPPLFYVLEYGVARLSTSEWALRLPSCLAGAAAVWVMWLVARLILDSRWAALLAAGLLAVSPLHIQYSQEARPYAVSFLFALAGVYALFAQFRHGGRWRALVWVALWPALAGTTLYFALGLTLTEIVWVALIAVPVFLAGRGKDRPTLLRRAVAVSAVGLVLALAAVVPFALRMLEMDVSPGGGGADVPSFSPQSLATTARALAFGGRSAVSGAVAWTVIGLAAVGAAAGLRRRRLVSFFLFLWLVALQLVQMYLYGVFGHWSAGRYHLIYIPPMLLFAAIGAETLVLGRFKRLEVPLQCAVLVLVAALAAAVQPQLAAARRNKPDIRKAARELAEKASPRECVTGSGLETVYVYNYYRERFHPSAPEICDLGTYLGETYWRLRRAPRVWVVYHMTWKHAEDSLRLLRAMCPDLPTPPPRQPIVRAIPDSPESPADVVRDWKTLRERWKSMTVSVPFSLDVRSLSRDFADPSWGGPRSLDDPQIVIRDVDARHARAFFVVEGNRATTLTIEAAPVPHDAPGRRFLSVYWDDALLATCDLVGQKGMNRISLPLPPAQPGEDTFHALTLSCRGEGPPQIRQTPYGLLDLDAIVAIAAIRLE